MKQILILSFTCICLHLNFSIQAQNNVGIGTNLPDATSILELVSANKGLLVPRMNTLGMFAIPSPANSLLVYNTDSMCYFFYRQPTTSWISMCALPSNNSTDTIYTNYSSIDTLIANYINIDSIIANYVNLDSLFASYVNIDSLFANYLNIDSIFSKYINVDSLFANYANVDSIFSKYINVDSLFAKYANIDSIFSKYTNVDSLFAKYANVDSIFSKYINVDSLFAKYANFDSIFSKYINVDSLFAKYANFDSLVVNGVSIHNLICNAATTNFVTKFTSPSSICNSIIFDNGTQVGIGTTSPAAKLEIAGQIKITGGAPGAGKVLTSDASGLAAWSAANAGTVAGSGTLNYVTKWTPNGTTLGNSSIFDNGTNVGVGTTSPATALDIGSKTDAVRLPSGTSAQRPVTPVNGDIRYNTTVPQLEGFASGVWNDLVGLPNLQFQKFTSSGTFTTPANITTSTVFKVTVIGGGGGGGGGQIGNVTGSGGGAGGVAIKYYSGLSPNTGYTVTVGTGGSGGAAQAFGNSGGTSSFAGPGTTIIASGANGGGVSTGGAGGAGINGDINLNGTSGGPFINAAFQWAWGGAGGPSIMGGGVSGGSGINTNQCTAGGSATSIGSGGGGGGAQSGCSSAGGNGAAGIVIIDWVR